MTWEKRKLCQPNQSIKNYIFFWSFIVLIACLEKKSSIKPIRSTQKIEPFRSFIFWTACLELGLCKIFVKLFFLRYNLKCLNFL